ncbi:MAG TPA: alpha/beta hydrolase [Chitinophagaceae bacterium]
MKYCFLLFFILVMAGCQKEISSSNDSNNTLPAQSYLNASYGSDAAQNMDVYLPAGRSKTATKVMILVHGGAWATGDKSDFAEYVDTLKKRLPDYAFFNINYRLASIAGNFFPTQENDVKSAISFILGKSDEYNISQRFVLLGASAGGHLALLQAYKHMTPVKAKAVIDFFGPTDMVQLYNQPADPAIIPVLQVLLSGTPASNPAQYQQSSPINYVTAQSPPTIIFHGGLDDVVPVSQSTALEAKLQAMGVAHQYLFYPTEGHDVWSGPNLTHSFNAIQAFLATHVN